jgi:hypothetical protein
VYFIFNSKNKKILASKETLKHTQLDFYYIQNFQIMSGLKYKQNIYSKFKNSYYLPQIFNGASSSSRIGWLRKSSRDFKHKPRISVSANCTFLPGFELRTVFFFFE